MDDGQVKEIAHAIESQNFQVDDESEPLLSEADILLFVSIDDTAVLWLSYAGNLTDLTDYACRSLLCQKP